MSSPDSKDNVDCPKFTDVTYPNNNQLIIGKTFKKLLEKHGLELPNGISPYLEITKPGLF